MTNCLHISGGGKHSVVVTADGVFTFGKIPKFPIHSFSGSSKFGQLGHGNNERCTTPTRIQNLEEKVTKSACGDSFTALISESKLVKCNR